jgi:hypothetical protein
MAGRGLQAKAEVQIWIGAMAALLSVVTLLGASRSETQRGDSGCHPPVLAAVQDLSFRGAMHIIVGILKTTSSSRPSKSRHLLFLLDGASAKRVKMKLRSSLSGVGRDVALLISLGQALLCCSGYVCGGVRSTLVACNE